jgi:hypothetical protein
MTAAERASDDRDLSIVARLRSDVSAATASVELGTLVQAASNGRRTARADEVHRTDVGGVKASLQALFAAALLTLLLACANVAALVGARNGTRSGEANIRSESARMASYDAATTGASKLPHDASASERTLTADRRCP